MAELVDHRLLRLRGCFERYMAQGCNKLALNATGDVSDDAAPAHPPWMTARAPPGVGNVEAGPRLVTEAPPAARAMAVERGASVESRETLAAGSEASGLEPLDEHDLLYELD